MSDGAILEIYTLEALRGSLLLGPYSRFGWHHPGPLYFYLLAPWYWASGLHTAGMQAGALAINLAAASLIVRTVIAAASPSTALSVSVFTAWYAVRAGDLVVSAWNPHVVVLPLIAYIVLAAAVASRPCRSNLLALVVVGVFLAQTHLAMVPVVLVLGAGAAWNGRRLPLATWAIAAGVTFLLWLPPLVEQLIHRPGNLASIVAFFLRGARGQGVTVAATSWASTLTAAFRPGFVLALGADSVPAGGWMQPAVALTLIATLIVLAERSRNVSSFDSWLLGMCAVASIVAFLATTRIQDHIIDHEIYWMSAIGTLSVAAAVGCVPALVAGLRQQRLRRIVLTTGVLAWMTVAFAGAEGMRRVLERRRTLDDHAVDVLTGQIKEYLESGGIRKPRFEINPPVWPIAAGALLQIDKGGTRFAVGERWSPMFGDRFAPTGDEDGSALISGSAVSTFVTPQR